VGSVRWLVDLDFWAKRDKRQAFDFYVKAEDKIINVNSIEHPRVKSENLPSAVPSETLGCSADKHVRSPEPH
jgi:hypothetical protein